jgi:DNA-binding transcriptional LysR family regulator
LQFKNLQSFVAVAESGSWADAARHLGLTAAAISARVHALEEELGAPLIRRAGRAVQPTDAGMRLLPNAQKVLREAEALKTIVKDDGLTGKLRLGVFASAMTGMLPPVLTQIYRHMPELEISVTPGASIQLCRMVENGDLDAALVVEPQFSLGKYVEWEFLLEEPLVVVCSTRQPSRDPLALLQTQPLIRYDRHVLGGQLADRFLRDQKIRPAQRMEINSIMAVASIVAEDLGVALLPDWQPLRQESLAIERLPLPCRTPLRRVGMVWKKEGPRTHVAEALLDHACQALGHWEHFAQPRAAP